MRGARRFILPGLVAALLAVVIAVVVTAPGGDPDRAAAPETTTPTTATTPTAVTTPTTTSPPPDATAPTGGVINVHTRVMPYRPGQTTWTHSGPGVAVTVRVNTSTPEVGEPVRFDIEVSSTAGPCCAVWFRPGERPPWEERPSCPPGEARGPDTVAFRQSHTYRTAGRFSFTVTGLTGSCTAPGAVASFDGYIDVQ